MAPAEFFASAVSTLFKDKLPSRNTDMAIANLLRSRSLLFREQTTLNELCPHCHEKKLCMWAKGSTISKEWSEVANASQISLRLERQREGGDIVAVKKAAAIALHYAGYVC